LIGNGVNRLPHGALMDSPSPHPICSTSPKHQPQKEEELQASSAMQMRFIKSGFFTSDPCLFSWSIIIATSSGSCHYRGLLP
jgi:hypothetical protein